MMRGKHQQINELIKYLTNKSSQSQQSQRVIAINGVRGTGACSMTKFTIKYVMDRKYIEHGAILIDAENKFTS
jgi:aspartate/tyrosine/aromatic aminotransferase